LYFLALGILGRELGGQHGDGTSLRAGDRGEGMLDHASARPLADLLQLNLLNLNPVLLQSQREKLGVRAVGVRASGHGLFSISVGGH
jgi:hypothetical protein